MSANSKKRERVIAPDQTVMRDRHCVAPIFRSDA
jgi:hypothetical protein